VADSHPISEVSSGKDVRTLERALQTLWEKARRVSELVIHLRSENETLRGQMQQMEQEYARLRAEADARQQELQHIKQQLVHHQSNGSDLFSKEEKEALKARIKELIVKINARL
jgi:predicted  nucleic acid-binding Zn-ribbon protein